MKKNELFKILGITFLIAVALTWIIPVGSYGTGEFVSNGTVPQGLFDLARTPLITFANLIQYAMFFIALGMFYGVVNRTGVYAKIVNSVSNKIKNKKVFLIVTTILFAVVSSAIGFTWGLFVVVPFIAAILAKIGYKNITQLMSTVGAMLIGSIGATYAADIAVNVSYYLGLDINSLIIAKAITFIILLTIYIMFIIKINKRNDGKTKGSKKNTKNEEKASVNESIVLYYDEENKQKSAVPLVIICLLSFIVILVAMFSWTEVLKVEFFYNLYEKMLELTVNDYPLIGNFIGTITPFGYWKIYDLIIFLILITFLIGWVYSLKLDQIIDAMKKGIKEMLPVAFYSTLASIVFALMISSNTGENIFYTIYNYVLTISDKFSIATMTIGSIFGGLFYNDFASLIYDVSLPITAYNNAELLPLMAFITQTIHGLTMFIVPTSVLLISGLTFFNVSYKDWLKTLWKFMLIVFGILIAMFIIISLILA